jgi:hypothetical protein
VITVYASASFVLIELVNNLTEPLNLPPGLATIVIVVLAVGFPLAIILSWLYDLTGEGMEKTKALKDPVKAKHASELNADAVVEPMVMCYGDSVCIQIRIRRWLWMYEKDYVKILKKYGLPFPAD